MFVVIEGIDGSGKGTVATQLLAKLTLKGVKAEKLSFPRYEQTRYGKLVGRYLNGEFGTEAHPYLHGTLFAMDRFESRDYLLNRLRNCDFILCDRYIPSNLCYSAMKAEEGERDALVRHFAKFEYGFLAMPVPDVIFFLDVPVEFAVQNIAKKAARSYTDKASDIFEADEQYLSRVRSFYMSQLMDYHPSTTCFQTVECVSNASLKPIDEIVENVCGMLFQMYERGID